ncbi:MAG: hypothetical protein FJZ38_08380 [Candidatus Rokubacteria bacterium]|nr:hypothetical protein [Candidatus Rokubacteria bacterium]
MVTGPDGVITGSTALLRAERTGRGNGRVYVITFEAVDGQGGHRTGSVSVGVPKSLKPGTQIIDDGQAFDSTKEPARHHRHHHHDDDDDDEHGKRHDRDGRKAKR